MEDDDGNNCVKPECGAIFITSSLTKNECFDRHVFALPSSKSEFVKHVKTGMILFLFEYEKRKLYGVFQATSDGELDIVPNGFRYSGRRFPAQVRFKTMWFCHPLSEREFKEAIRDNYFSNNKFRFGLAEYQVRRLLSLFNSKKVNKNPPYRAPQHVKDLTYVGSDDLKRRDRAFTEDDDYKLSSDYQVDSFLRSKECELMKRCAVNDGRKGYSVAQDLWTDNYDGFLTKKRRLDYQDRLLYRDLAENENYADFGMSRSSCIGSPIEVRRSMECQRLVKNDRRYNENQADELLNPVNKYPTEPLEARRIDYDQYMQRNCLFSDPNFGDSLNDQYSNLLKNYAIEGNVLRNDDGLLRDCNSIYRDKPLVSSDRDFDIVAQAMNRTDYHQRLLNEEFCDDSGPMTASVPFTSRFHIARRSSAGGMFPDYNVIEGEQEFVTPITGSSTEFFSRPLDIERKMFYDRKIRLAEERVTDKMFENCLSSTNCRSSGGNVENVDGVPTCIGRAMSKYCSPISTPQKIFSSSEKSIPETRIISTGISVSPNHHNPSSTFDDPTTTIVADPCICELPRAAQRCHAPEAADWDSSFRQESHPYSLSKSSASQILSAPFKCSKFVDQELERTISLSKSVNPYLSRHGVPHTYTPADDNLYTPHGQLQTSSPYVSDHATCNNHMESKEDIICETKNVSQAATYSPTALDLSSKEHHKVSDASTQSDPCTTRRSVFDRLKRPPVDEDRNDGDFNDFDHCMEASAEKVMEMLLPGNTLPLRMPNYPKLVAEPKNPGSFDLDKNHPQCQIDLTTHSTSEEKNLNDSFLSNEESVEEVPRESRVVDFKRRSKKKRSLVGTTFESATDIINPKGEAGNPMRRRKLVRPLFGKAEAAPKIIGSDTAVSELTHVGDDKQNYQVQIISSDKSEVLIDDASVRSPEYRHNKNNNQSDEELKYLGVENCGLQVTPMGHDKQNCQTSNSNDESELQIVDASLISHEFPHDKKNNRSKEQMCQGAENCSVQVTRVGDDKQIDDASHASPPDKKNNHIEVPKDLEVENCSLQVTRSISNGKSEVQIGNARISGHRTFCNKKNNPSEKQKDMGDGNFSVQVTRVDDDEQSNQISISSHKAGVQVDDASLGRHESSHEKKIDHSEEQKDLGAEKCSLEVTYDKQSCRKGLSNDKGDVQNDNSGLSSHESPRDKKNDNSKEQAILGVENSSLQVQHEKTTQEQNCRLENSTILPKEVDSTVSTVESLKHEEPSLEKLKPDARFNNSREARKVRLVNRIVKKIVKIRNAKVCPGKGQNFNNEKDKPTSENSQGKSEVVSIMNIHVPEV